MSSMTSEVLDPTGSHWPGMASSEIAVTTAVPASSSGMPAAISAPNVSSSRTRVTGIEVSSAWWKSWPICWLATRSSLASPASVTSSDGCAACTAATARSAGPTRLSSSLPLPGTVKLISSERRSAEVTGGRMCGRGPGQRPQPRRDLRRRRAGGRVGGTVPCRDWIRTCSAGGEVTFRSFSVRSAWPDWPVS